MSLKEKTGFRDQFFSQWHRTLPNHCCMIDGDWIEYCHRCQEPLLLWEVAMDKGQAEQHKSTHVIRNLARRANLPGHLLLYLPNTEFWRTRKIWPNNGQALTLERVTPDMIGDFIVSIHDQCYTCERRKIVGL